MCGQIDEWTDGRMDGWVGGCVKLCVLCVCVLHVGLHLCEPGSLTESESYLYCEACWPGN